jgi:predicted O-methyltransferase YrrM
MIKELFHRIFQRYNRQLMPTLNLPGAQYSVILPADAWKSKPTPRLIDLALAAIAKAQTVNHQDIADKMIERPQWPVIWPGEHYKLLSALIQVIAPQVVVEIGTATGYSALAMKKFLKPGAKLYSFDIVPWTQFPKCILNEVDFQDGSLVQIIDDLTHLEIFRKHQELLATADFVFIDAAKDGHQEQVFIDLFKTVQFKSKPIFMFDDIRVMNMIEIWQNLDKPKLDLTSFGHWAGTGLVDWTA